MKQKWKECQRVSSTNVYKNFISVEESMFLTDSLVGYNYANVIIHVSVGESQGYSPPLQ